MSRSIYLNPTKTSRQEIVLEGNELVIYTTETDPNQPRMWLDGCEYRFNTQLVNVQRVPGRKIPLLAVGL